MIPREYDAGVKHDGGKLPVHLLPPDGIETITKVLEFGQAKYGARNWEKGMSFSRLYGAAIRHLFAWWSGKDNDAESGLPHIAHAACCLLFLVTYTARKIGTDDRPKNAA